MIKNNKLIKEFMKTIRYLYFKNFHSDEQVIKKRFRKYVKREVNLENPVHFNDKLQWLKLNWYDPVATICADKYEVRNYVREKIGDQYLNELNAVYDSVEDINIEDLPKSFVMKATHGSGDNIICENKNNVNWDKELKILGRALSKNIYWITREWVYKDITPKVICERLLTDKYNDSLIDYKFYCFNGKPHFCQVIQGRDGNETIDFFNMKWEHMPFTGLRAFPNSNKRIKRPDAYNEMIELAKVLSKDFPFVRVDFYYVNKKIYFGELTFFPKSGFGKFEPFEWNEKIGDLLKLPYKDGKFE